MSKMSTDSLKKYEQLGPLMAEIELKSVFGMKAAIRLTSHQHRVLLKEICKGNNELIGLVHLGVINMLYSYLCGCMRLKEDEAVHTQFVLTCLNNAKVSLMDKTFHWTLTTDQVALLEDNLMEASPAMEVVQ